MNLADLLKKKLVRVPLVVSVLVGTFTGVKKLSILLILLMVIKQK